MIRLHFIYPELSDIKFELLLFPDGQPHLKLDMASIELTDRRTAVQLVSRITGPNDLLLVLLAKNTLDYLGFDQVELHISYLMAARMDRVMQHGEPFALKVVAGLLNSALFKKILILDPHSEVATALIDRSYPVTNHEFVRDALSHYFTTYSPGAYFLVSPDAGALKKIHHLAQFLEVTNVIECFKERDLKTGNLSGFTTPTERLHGETCFIIDDICDGGGTFAGTAAMLKRKGAGKVALIVTHGIFSKGIEIPGIDTIYTTDSYRVVPGVNSLEVGRYL